MADAHRTLLRLATGDDTTAKTAREVTAPTPLGGKADALVRISALIALGAAPAAYVGAIRRALACGASVEEVLDTLVAVSTTVGLSRVVVAVSGIGLGLGYDIDAALQG